MDIHRLKHRADEVMMSASYSPSRLVLIHTAVLLAVSLLLMALSEALSAMLVAEGGLSGMGTQAMLDTAQVVLQLISFAVTPFWTAGLARAVLQLVRGEAAGPDTLPEGFRRWKKVLSSTLLVGLRYLGVGFLAGYLAMQVFVLTPMALPLYEAMIKVNADPSLDMAVLLSDSVQSLRMGYLAVFAVVFAVLALPTYYRYCMVPYLVMDGEGMGGFRAMLTSRWMTQRRRMALFRVDLNFWWFYLAEAAISALCFGYLLPGLPMSEDVAYWVFQIAAMLGQLALYYFAKPKLELIHGQCYELLRQPEAQIAPPKKKTAKSHPWAE